MAGEFLETSEGMLMMGVREDGTVDGCAVETHFLPLDYAVVVPGADGFLRIIGDGDGVNYEMRVPFSHLARVIDEQRARLAAQENPSGI